MCGYWESYSDSMIWHYSIEALAGVDVDYAFKTIVRVMDDVGKGEVHAHFKKGIGKFRPYCASPTDKSREFEALMELANLSAEFMLKHCGNENLMPMRASERMVKGALGGVCCPNKNVQEASAYFIEKIATKNARCANLLKDVMRKLPAPRRDVLFDKLSEKVPVLVALRHRLPPTLRVDGRFAKKQENARAAVA